MSSDTSALRASALDVAALVFLRAALSIAAVRTGFVSVSDDDYSRTVIAEAFAHAPKLDPSGTSWLPFPFWITGLSMMALGRTIAVAKFVSWTLGTFGMSALYITLRSVNVPRVTSVLAVVLTLLLPWNLWLGVAAVPESYCAYFTAVAVVSVSRTDAPIRPYALGLLGAAALSRYEVWPVCSVVAIVELVKALRAMELRMRHALCALLAAAGPALWLVWNRVSHGDFFHSLQRVSRFRHALGADTGSSLDKALFFPKLLLAEHPFLLGLTAAALAYTLLRATPPLATRARFFITLAALVSVLAFLAYGNLRDGAPTHHAARALLPVALLLAILVAETGSVAVRSLTRARSAREAWAFAFLIFAAIVGAHETFVALHAPPGNGVEEERTMQIARGAVLRHENAKRVVVEPCAFEHFALIAAFGAPELVEVRAASGRPVGRDCPLVVVTH